MNIKFYVIQAMLLILHFTGVINLQSWIVLAFIHAMFCAIFMCVFVWLFVCALNDLYDFVCVCVCV